MPAPADRTAPWIPGHDRLIRRRIAALAALGVGLCVAFLLDIATGPSNLSLETLARTLLDPSASGSGTRVIVWDVRLPAAAMAVLVGAALSLAGTEMQTTLNNPLASPFTLGISSAASFGAALAIVLGLAVPGASADWAVPTNAFLFAFGSVLLLQILARMRGTGVESLTLFGIALVFAFNALVALIQYIASPEALQQLVFWSMGSLARANGAKLQILALVLALCVPFSLRAAWPLTALRLGEDRALSFGVRVPHLRFFSLLRVSALAAASVAFVGTIGFIGLAGPHIARLLVGEDHRYLLPASMLSGALLLSLASAASKTIVPGVLLPVGLVTALIGIPFFVALIFFSQEGRR